MPQVWSEVPGSKQVAPVLTSEESGPSFPGAAPGWWLFWLWRFPQEQKWQTAALHQQSPRWNDSLSSMILFRFSHEPLNWKHWSTLFCMVFEFCFLSLILLNFKPSYTIVLIKGDERQSQLYHQAQHSSPKLHLFFRVSPVFFPVLYSIPASPTR